MAAALQMTPVIVLTTVGASFDARPLATDLVEKRLAACVNIIPGIHSVYRWQGKVERDDEQLLLIKTVEERIRQLKEALFAAHPYEVPEFVVIAIHDVAEPYRQWLVGSTTSEESKQSRR
jgi:periplasmic divalent cation tolerance protein